MSISPMVLVGGSGMIAVAVGLIAYALFRSWGWKYLLLGMLGWVVTVAVKIAIAIPLNPPVLAATDSMSDPLKTLVLFLYGGALTGVTEVLIVWAVLRYTRLVQVNWSRVLAFGVGFGAIEAFLLGISALAAALTAIYTPDALPQAVLGELEKADRLVVQLAPIWERFFTCLGHLATNAMIFYAARLPRGRWLAWAFIYKSAIDGIATLSITTGFHTTPINLWILEFVVALWALAGVAATVWISRRWPDSNSEADRLREPASIIAEAEI